MRSVRATRADDDEAESNPFYIITGAPGFGVAELSHEQRNVAFWHLADLGAAVEDVCLRVDCVAKLFELAIWLQCEERYFAELLIANRDSRKTRASKRYSTMHACPSAFRTFATQSPSKQTFSASELTSAMCHDRTLGVTVAPQIYILVITPA